MGLIDTVRLMIVAVNNWIADSMSAQRPCIYLSQPGFRTKVSRLKALTIMLAFVEILCFGHNALIQL